MAPALARRTPQQPKEEGRPKRQAVLNKKETPGAPKKRGETKKVEPKKGEPKKTGKAKAKKKPEPKKVGKIVFLRVCISQLWKSLGFKQYISKILIFFIESKF